jgi:NAD(P)-dependent dehydrogenase (short-subunit alcohol dehydrogenase family)
MGDIFWFKDEWALILGASSGFGAATSLELAKNGMNIFGVHLDRKETLPNVEKIIQSIRGMGQEAEFFNINAADPKKKEATLDFIEKRIKPEGKKIKIFLHSLAFGTVRPFIDIEGDETVTKPQMEMTLDVMAHSLVYWIQGLLKRGLIGDGSRIYAMTSAGGHRVWRTYGAVSAAKAALESHIRQLALELAPLGITCNAIQAGVTDTPALRKIPGHEKMKEYAKLKNPMGRLTLPEDVAKAIKALSHPDTYWMTGNVIRVDGGEDIVG